MILRLPCVGETWIGGQTRTHLKIVDTTSEDIKYLLDGRVWEWSKDRFLEYVIGNPESDWAPE